MKLQVSGSTLKKKRKKEGRGFREREKEGEGRGRRERGLRFEFLVKKLKDQTLFVLSQIWRDDFL